MKILVQYLAFGSNRLFEFTARPEGLDVREMEIGELLEYVFRQCNHVDETEWISRDPYASTLRLRSMSAGDVVVIIDGGKVSRFLCAPSGWEPVQDVF